MEAWNKGEFTEAIHLMKKTGKQIPDLINQGLLCMQCYRKTGESKYLQAAEQALLQVNHKQPEDVQVNYLLSRLYLYAQMPEMAFPIAKELATNYPKNSLYLSILSDVLYQQGEKETALDPLVNAIRYTPRLLTGSRIRDFQQNDISFYNMLPQQRSALTPAPDDNPGDYARYGYIARWYDNKFVSDKYLWKAINEMPNFATPWYLLGDDNKYRVLLYGAFHKDLLSIELPKEKEMSDELLFEEIYQTKFENWYGKKLVLLTL
jgi:tetratricopeptide (TPR) repeat protein